MQQVPKLEQRSRFPLFYELCQANRNFYITGKCLTEDEGCDTEILRWTEIEKKEHYKY